MHDILNPCTICSAELASAYLIKQNGEVSFDEDGDIIPTVDLHIENFAFNTNYFPPGSTEERDHFIRDHIVPHVQSGGRCHPDCITLLRGNCRACSRRIALTNAMGAVELRELIGDVREELGFCRRCGECHD